MKILFINISDIKGGAAIATWRIANQLEKDYGTENLFLVRDKFSDKENVIPTRGNKIIYKLEWAINVFFNLIGLQYKFLPFSSRKILKTARKFKPDVISLNQIEGGYFQTRDMIKLSKIAPIVWTMHDLWAITNNAHRLPDLKSTYPSVGIRWGDWLKHQKEKIYSKIIFDVVYPSKFVEIKCYTEENYIAVKESVIIPHGVDLEKFKPNDEVKKENAIPYYKFDYQDEHKYPEGRILTLLFVAEKIEKGGDLLWQILDELDKLIDSRVIVYLIGESKGNYKNTYKNISTYGTGYIWGEDELIKYYQQADVFVYPSQADIFGLVLIEAMACGLPIVTTNVDAIPEVTKGKSFILKDAHTIAEIIKHFLVDKYWSRITGKNNRNLAIENYDIKQTAKKYYQLFEGI